MTTHTPGESRLIQFQCGKEGTLFYYQSSMICMPFVWRCPLCGSRRITATGREFKAVDENAAIAKATGK